MFLTIFIAFRFSQLEMMISFFEEVADLDVIGFADGVYERQSQSSTRTARGFPVEPAEDKPGIERFARSGVREAYGAGGQQHMYAAVWAVVDVCVLYQVVEQYGCEHLVHADVRFLFFLHRAPDAEMPVRIGEVLQYGGKELLHVDLCAFRKLLVLYPGE